MAVKGNIYIDQGTTFSTNIELFDENDNPIDVAGYSAESQIRKHYSSLTAVNFTTSLSTGLLVLSLSANTSMNMKAGRYVYDAKLTAPDGSVIRLVEGLVTINPAVSQ